MKNTTYLLLLCAVVTFLGCQKDNLEVQPEDSAIERSSERKKKVKVCHCTYGGGNGPQWKVIKVNKNAVRAHIRHGDFKMKDKDKDGFYKANPCVPQDEVDCDDNNKFVNPACAEDPTNGIDDNCDGEVDEGGGIDSTCPLVDALNLNDLSPIQPTGTQPFGSGLLYLVSTEFDDGSGTPQSAMLGVIVIGLNYAYAGGYYMDDGTFVDIAPLIFDGPNPDLVQGVFADFEEAEECTSVLESIIAPFSSN